VQPGGVGGDDSYWGFGGDFSLGSPGGVRAKRLRRPPICCSPVLRDGWVLLCVSPMFMGLFRPNKGELGALSSAGRSGLGLPWFLRRFWAIVRNTPSAHMRQNIHPQGYCRSFRGIAL